MSILNIVRKIDKSVKPPSFKQMLSVCLWTVIVSAGVSLSYPRFVRILRQIEPVDIEIPQKVQTVDISRKAGNAFVNFEIINHSNKDVTIHGIHSDCGCLLAQDLPLTIKSMKMGNLSFRLEIDPKEPLNHYTREATVYMDSKASTIESKLKINVNIK